MADDGEVRIKTTIDNSQLDKGLKNAESKIKKSAKTINDGAKSTQKFGGALKDAAVSSNSFSSGLSNAAKSGGAYAAAIAAGIAVAKKFIEGIRETSEAFKVQEKAELSLQAASENNPYISGSGVKRLKEFAAELQKVTNIGDEETIRLEAMLVNTGRTEEEIKKIMRAAADYAAATGTDIQSAVQTLNATFSGMSGTIGRQIGAIKDLTEEELKNGKAVDLVAEKYKGMAKASLDARTQAKNAKGDLMEAWGAITKPTADAWDNFWKGFYEKGIKTINKINSAFDFVRENWIIGGDYRWAEDFKNGIIKNLKEVAENKKSLYLEDNAEILGDKELGILTRHIESQKKRNKEESEFLEILKREQTHREKRKQSQEEDVRVQEKVNKLTEQEKKSRLDFLSNEKNRNTTEETKEYAELLRMQKESDEKAIQAAQSAKDKYSETIKAKKEDIELRRKMGEEITAEQEAQEIYNTKVAAFMELAKGFKDVNNIYIDGKNVLSEIVKDAEKLKSAESALEKISELAGGAEASAKKLLQDTGREETLTSTLQVAIEALKEQKELFKDNEEAAAKFNEKIKELEELLPKVKLAELQETIDDAKDEKQLSKVEELENKKAALKAQYAAAEVEREQLTADEKLRIQEDYKNALENLENQITEAQEEANNQRLQNVSDMVSQVQNYVSQTVSIMKDASNLMLETVRNNSKAELATLEKQYLQGEISEEEYEKKKIEAKKKAAKEEYKIQMFQWSISILEATANIAQGVTKAIAQGGIAGIITGALVAAAGAVQIASIIASKPTPPSFAGGGIVQGNSYTGDKVRANVNSGEMILNATQQKALWEAANGRGANGNGANITINNSASNIVSAQPRITKGQIEIWIDARVNDSLKNGRYDQSLTMANQGMSGEYYGI